MLMREKKSSKYYTGWVLTGSEEPGNAVRCEPSAPHEPEILCFFRWHRARGTSDSVPQIQNSGHAPLNSSLALLFICRPCPSNVFTPHPPNVTLHFRSSSAVLRLLVCCFPSPSGLGEILKWWGRKETNSFLKLGGKNPPHMIYSKSLCGWFQEALSSLATHKTMTHNFTAKFINKHKPIPVQFLVPFSRYHVKTPTWCTHWRNYCFPYFAWKWRRPSSSFSPQFYDCSGDCSVFHFVY